MMSLIFWRFLKLTRPPGRVSLFPTWINSRLLRKGPNKIIREVAFCDNGKLTNKGNTWRWCVSQDLLVFGKIFGRVDDIVADFKLGHTPLSHLFP